ncbi:putative Acid phosphatase [Medicago truncatula]|uniref:Putative Acid phosphatase n=1 Tax=Medicago truncatula TaxID=3880 RepID=G7LGQ4_MEDTR|nr:stem 28 kDa glycoprotein [Medicago truncatula]AET01534.1 stem 28 kDa glycoprotein [Medicago truncatula]AFK40192.1 unknown [Medicago truncatula]RHN39155.1 putative Acid phosphatase [Medicago truncatula]
MKILLFFLVTLLATCHGNVQNHEHESNFNIFPLRMKTGPGGKYIPEVSCASWRVAVEARNIINWKTVPQECEEYVGNYMLGDQYRADSKFVNREGFFYARTLNLKDGRDLWVFDIDETTLSNLPYYATHGFGVNPYNETLFNAWVDEGAAPALPETQKLYNKLVNLGVKIAFLTGRPLKQKDITAKNLKEAGYHTYEKLILKDTELYHGKTAVQYKSSERKKLEEEGWRIIGNSGDQWSDILGTNTGERTFKLPDPLYYIA